MVSAFVKPGAWGDVGMEHVHGFDTSKSLPFLSIKWFSPLGFRV